MTEPAQSRRRILVAAGEVSGDRMAAAVVRELSFKYNELQVFGFGGRAMERAGVRLLERQSVLAVTGLTEALRRGKTVAGLLRRLARELRSDRPDLGILVDYPGLNLRLAGMLRRAGVPVLYLGAPQRWAWLGFRTTSLARKVDRLAVTLPFEQAWFRARGVDAHFVGHPTVEQFVPLPRAEARAAVGAEQRPLLALLPGSRENEIRRHLPILVRTARLLAHRFDPLLAVVPGRSQRLCSRLAPRIRQTDARHALCAADVALCASGTVTLEAALAGIPTAVFYRLSRLSHAVARALVQVPYIALPNLILDRPLLPELIQQRMTPDALADQALRLHDPDVARTIRAGLAEVVRKLGPTGAAVRVADIAVQLMEKTG